MAGSGEASAPRWVVVIDRAQQELFELLRESLKPDAPFRVILDRRQGERRRGERAVAGPERRSAERRQQRPAGSFFIEAVVPVNGAEPAAPPPTPADPASSPPPPPAASTAEVVTAACPTCWTVLTFEMPRFPKPPARLDSEIIHELGGTTVQHFAEIQAFTISGRPLLVQRVQAIRQRPSV